MREIKKISYSFLHTLACPYAAFLRYEAQIKAPETEYLAFGSALHLALEEEHRDKKFDLSKAVHLFLVDFRRRIEDNSIFIQWPKLKKMESDGITILEKYYDQLTNGKFPAPTVVEQEFSLPFMEIEIVGKIDAIEHEQESGYLTVIDYKSGSKKPDPWFLRHNLQFTAYAWAARELYGKLPDKIYWHHLRTGERLETTRTDEDINDLKVMINNALVMNQNGIRHRVFHEAICDWCEYSGTRGRSDSICDDRELERSILEGDLREKGETIPSNS